MNASSVVFDPLLPWAFIWAASAAMAVLLALSAWRGLVGWFWRLAGAALILGAIANPSLQFEERDPLADIVVLVTDTSASQTIADRPDQTENARAGITADVEARGNVEVRQVTVGDAPDNAGTTAMAELSAALAEVPPDRLAGVIMLSDGQVHDAALAPNLPAPMHLLLTGEPGDWDRRLIVENAPAFAILGEPVSLRVRIEDQGAAPAQPGPLEIAVSVDGGEAVAFPARVGEAMELQVSLPHGGINVLHISLATEQGELTDRNNQAVVQINGVRDRLSVLLVSGEPHPGGRTWRNLLKSDSAVDLVHFTILRPPEKQDGVPVTELSLIAFPTRELFLDKIDEFDLIIFDRYKRRGILPNQYLDNIRAYVEAGGALLLAAGPEFATANSLFHSPIGEMMPLVPSGHVIEQGFKPAVTELGARHPVTEGLDGDWGDWLRQIEIETSGGQVAMSGISGAPLLVLDRVGEGRVAMLASDQAWLWSRGYQGGGPQMDLLRRLAHWMMKEPELEEESLSVNSVGQHMTITRRSLTEEPRELTITRPDGEIEQLALQEAGPGRFTAEYDGPEMGLYRLTDGVLAAVAALGPAAPKEFEETVASGDKLALAVASTRGGVLALSGGSPQIRWVPEGRVAAGNGWIGLTPRNASVTTSVSLREIMPAWLALLLVTALALAAWLREGRR